MKTLDSDDPVVLRRHAVVRFLDSIGQPQDGHVILRLEQILTGLADEELGITHALTTPDQPGSEVEG